MRGLIVLSCLIVLLQALTDSEIAFFNDRRNPNKVEQNTSKKSKVKITDNGDGTLTVVTNSIPNHDTWVFPRGDGNPHTLEEVWKEFTINKEPRLLPEGEETMCLPHGNIGVATSGTVIDSWFASEKGCPTAEEFEELDICEGHPSPSNQYHYHHYSPCVQMQVCDEPSPIYGVAVDGIPIYGPYDEYGVQLTSQDLDKCGGKYDNTGRYKYHVTVDPPYYLGCFKGEIRADLNKGENRGWFCSCPFDDSMMRPRGQGKKEEKERKEGKGPKPPKGEKPKDGPEGKPNTPEMCDWNNPDDYGTAQCDNYAYNTTYKISVKWVPKRKPVKLAACCPRGMNCGDSCKAEGGGLAEGCIQETRNIGYTTRVYLNGTEVPANWDNEDEADELNEEDEEEEDEGDCSNEEWRCFISCMDSCAGPRGLTKKQKSRIGKNFKSAEICEPKCGPKCGMEKSCLVGMKDGTEKRPKNKDDKKGGKKDKEDKDDKEDRNDKDDEDRFNPEDRYKPDDRNDDRRPGGNRDRYDDRYQPDRYNPYGRDDRYGSRGGYDRYDSSRGGYDRYDSSRGGSGGYQPSYDRYGYEIRYDDRDQYMPDGNRDRYDTSYDRPSSSKSQGKGGKKSGKKSGGKKGGSKKGGSYSSGGWY